MKYLKIFYERWRRLGIRVLTELTLPSTGAVIWAVDALRNGETVFKSLSVGGVAFGFLLFAQGQLFRMAKNVRDEQNAEEFRNSFANIQQGLEELRREKVLEPVTAEAGIRISTSPNKQGQARTIRDDVAASRARSDNVFGTRPYYSEISASLDQGLFYSAVLTAAVGFEHAVRVAGRYLDIDTVRQPSFTVVSEIGRRLESRELLHRLRTLLRLRNSLVHAETKPGEVTKAQAQEAIQEFTNGINLLELALVEYDRELDRRYFSR